MRKIFKYILCATTAFYFIGCSELEENPIGTLSPEAFFNTERDSETAMFGAYAALTVNNVYGRNYQMMVSLPSDMTDIGNPGTSPARVEMNNFTYSPTNGVINSYWQAIYVVIMGANNVIDGTPKIDATEEVKNQYIAEARVLRGYCYYQLVRLFGEVPLITTFISDPASVSDISRSSVDDVYNSIIDDFKFGIEHLPSSYGSGYRSRPTSLTAYAMLASVHLTRKNYTEAYANAKMVIDNAAANNISLVDDMYTLFDADQADVDEVLWSVDYLANMRESGGSYHHEVNSDRVSPVVGVAGSSQSGWSVMAATVQTLESFNDLDPRKELAFTTEVDGVTWEDFLRPKPHLAKHRRTPGVNTNAGNGTDSDSNYIIMRYAEVLLIAAEAIIEGGGGSAAEATDYINQIRIRAGVLPIVGTVDRDAVREERRVELAFEWKRWYDMIRYDDGDITKYFGEGTLAPGTAPAADIMPQKFHNLFPIPQDEIDRNPNLLPQNPGY